MVRGLGRSHVVCEVNGGMGAEVWRGGGGAFQWERDEETRIDWRDFLFRVQCQALFPVLLLRVE